MLAFIATDLQLYRAFKIMRVSFFWTHVYTTKAINRSEVIF